ncbi:MAG: efflux RND transporter periplasmic adaptor subunit [Planctomycetota bacterium]|nr:efflux RND transporter periplasmic adaptor subunit [Planctomycetota bacterium]
MWKSLIIAAAILALGCVGAGYFVATSKAVQDQLRALDPSQKLTEVRVNTAAKGSLVRVVSAPGTTEPETKAEISAQVAARILELPFREGASVKRGDVIARLDAVDLVANLNASKANLRAEEMRLLGLRSTLTNAESELARQKKLLETNDTSKARFDQALTDYERARSSVQAGEAEVEAAKSRIERAQKDVDNTIVRAPFDATIIKLDREIGELVVVGTLNTPGSAIMTVANMEKMIVKARVDESQVAPVKPGQTVRVYINSFPGRTFPGAVEHVTMQRTVDRDGTAYFETRIALEKVGDVQLYSGMTANVDIEVETFKDVIKVPSQAVVDRALEDLPKDLVSNSPLIDRSKKFARVVFVYENGKALAVPVSTGPSDLTDTVITAGLEPGRQVIVGPFKALTALRNDQKVALEADTPKPGEVRTASNTDDGDDEEAADADGR